MNRKFKLGWALIALAIGALAAPALAGAHVTVQPTELKPGGFARLDVRVPNERDKASTTKVQVQFPSGFYFLNYEPKSGWDVKIEKEKLAKPVKVFGENQTEQISGVTMTAAKGQKGIEPGQFEDFGLSGGPVPGKAGQSLSFKAIQTYSNGEVVRWIDPNPDAETPAAQVKMASAQPAAAPSSDDSSDSASKGLGVLALILGGLGLLAGITGLLLGRRQKPATA
jgi:uncharacterized protein YcnI